MENENTADHNAQDPAFRILRDADLDNAIKADLWDDFWEAASAKALASLLKRFDVPQPLKEALVTARKALEPGQHERMVTAITQLSKLDPAILMNAEKHPNLLRMLIEPEREESDTEESGG